MRQTLRQLSHELKNWRRKSSLRGPRASIASSLVNPKLPRRRAGSTVRVLPASRIVCIARSWASGSGARRARGLEADGEWRRPARRGCRSWQMALAGRFSPWAPRDVVLPKLLLFGALAPHPVKRLEMKRCPWIELARLDFVCFPPPSGFLFHKPRWEDSLRPGESGLFFNYSWDVGEVASWHFMGFGVNCSSCRQGVHPSFAFLGASVG